jgi:hypothetical protein
MGGFGSTGWMLHGGTPPNSYLRAPDPLKRGAQNIVDVVWDRYRHADFGLLPPGTDYLLAVDFDSPQRNANAITPTPPGGTGQGLIGKPANVLLAGVKYPGLPEQPVPLEGAAAPGDSGGGLFIRDGATNYLAGITLFSATPGNNGRYGEISVFARVSKFIDWLKEIIGIKPPSPVLLYPPTPSQIKSISSVQRANIMFSKIYPLAYHAPDGLDAEGNEGLPVFDSSLPGQIDEDADYVDLCSWVSGGYGGESIVSMPEPSTIVMLALGGLAMAGYLWRKRR